MIRAQRLRRHLGRLAQAKGEVQLAADQFEWFSEETKRIYGQTVESRSATRSAARAASAAPSGRISTSISLTPASCPAAAQPRPEQGVGPT